MGILKGFVVLNGDESVLEAKGAGKTTTRAAAHRNSKMVTTVRGPADDIFAPVKDLGFAGSGDIFDPGRGLEMGLTFSPGGDENLVQGVHDFQARDKFRSLIQFFIGRRGSGKSLAMSALAAFQRERYKIEGWDGRIWSNFKLDFADVNDPFLVDRINAEPWKFGNMLILIDEIAGAFDNRRPMNQHIIDFSNFLINLRKLHTECFFATQFPQYVDLRILQQVDLFNRTHSILGGRAVDLDIYDWWGQFTGNDSRKPWPPRPDEHDWDLTIHNTDAVWGHYETDEQIASLYSESRQQQIEQSWDRVDDEDPIGDVTREVATVLQDDKDEEAAVVQGDIESLRDRLAALPDTISVRNRLRLLRRYDPELTVDTAQRLLKTLGYKIYKEARGYMAKKRQTA